MSCTTTIARGGKWSGNYYDFSDDFWSEVLSEFHSRVPSDVHWIPQIAEVYGAVDSDWREADYDLEEIRDAALEAIHNRYWE